MSDSESSLIDSSFEESEEETSISEDIKTEKNDEGNNEVDRNLNRVIFCLVVTILVSFVVIVILIFVLIFCLNKSDTNPKKSNHYPRDEEEANSHGYEYRFFRVDDDNTKIRGSISTPFPIDEPMSIYTDEGLQVMLVLPGLDDVFTELPQKEVKLPLKSFDVQVEALCCPEPIDFDTLDIEDGSCHMIDSSRFLWPGTSEEEVYKEIIDSALHGSVYRGNMRITVHTTCEEGFGLVPNVQHLEETETPITFVCFGICGPPLFSEFEKKHEEKFTKIAVNKLQTFHSDHKDQCYDYSSSMKITDAGSDGKRAREKFLEIVRSYCAGVEVTNYDENMAEEWPKVSNFCVARQGGCSFTNGINDLPLKEIKMEKIDQE